MQDYMPGAKLAGKLNPRVMPEFMTVRDEPTRESWEDTRLAGYKLVDDEGVPTEDVTLVEDGRLVGLPTGRSPTKKLTESNGDAITFPNQWTESFDEGGSALLTGPVVAYKVYADGGWMEPVRGLAFDELSIGRCATSMCSARSPRSRTRGRQQARGCTTAWPS
ncbi:MAG: metallopeptidase TldD-related protein [Candidatus Eisenbacteria bacterium]